MLRFAGYSLIEVLMVVAVVAVLSAIAAPRVSGSLTRQRAIAAAKRVAADLEYARARAMASSASCKVVFSPGRGAYVLPGVSNPLDRTSAPYMVRVNDAPYKCAIAAVSFGDDKSLRHQVFGNDEVGEVVFDGFGVPDTTGWVVVRCGPHLYKVTLDASGRASIAPTTKTVLQADISQAPFTVIEVAEAK